MTECMYCKRTTTVFFTVKKAIKPPKTPFRWEELGYCCKDCANTKSIIIDNHENYKSLK